MRVEVAYARPDVQFLVSIEVDAGAMAKDAIEKSGLLLRFREIDLCRNKIGIFSKICGLEQRLMPGDRVEIYRPLTADPQDLRRKRLARQGQR